MEQVWPPGEGIQNLGRGLVLGGTGNIPFIVEKRVGDRRVRESTGGRGVLSEDVLSGRQKYKGLGLRKMASLDVAGVEDRRVRQPGAHELPAVPG